MSVPVLFLDRDGTINVDVDFLGDPDQLELIDGAATSLARLREAGVRVIVITNQSGIARGRFGHAELEAVHARLQEMLRPHGAAVDGFYACPHHPDFTGPCRCRKPGTALLARAAREHDLDWSRAAMVGDKASDLGSGRHAGIDRILVRTGYGAASERAGEERATVVVPSIVEATQWFLARHGLQGSGAPQSRSPR